MPASVVDFDVDQGATKRVTILWTQTVAGVKQPIDVTGYSRARMQVRRTQKSPVLLELDSGDFPDPKGGITIGGADGAFHLHMTPAQTNLLVAKTAKYDLEVTAPDGDVLRVAKGTIAVDPNITQDETDPVVTA